jgi:hypothetical protein
LSLLGPNILRRHIRNTILIFFPIFKITTENI